MHHLLATTDSCTPRKGILLFFCSIFFCSISPLQISANTTYHQYHSPIPSKPPHYRGLLVTTNNTIWVSGTRGSVLRGIFNDSYNLQWDTCKTQYPRKDFRDIWALDQNTAVAMSIADSAVIIKTTDGGQTWQTVYHDETPNIFLDVIEIDPKTGIGIILGDPLNGHFKSLFTHNFGSSWIEIPAGEWNTPTDSLASFFAASGTSLSIISSKANHKKQKFTITAGFAGGGLNPQFHLVQFQYKAPKVQSVQSTPSSTNPSNSNTTTSDPSADKPSTSISTNPHWKISNLPKKPLHMKGGPAWGCYGLTTYQTQKGIAVGGNYALPTFRGDSTGAIAAYTYDILGNWHPAKTPPAGYRSGICISADLSKDTLFNLFFGDSRNHCQSFYDAFGEQPADYFFKTHHRNHMPVAICTGTTGTDISFDGGKHWLPLSQERGFNACAWSCSQLILAGNLGKVQSLSLREISEKFRQLNPLSTSR